MTAARAVEASHEPRRILLIADSLGPGDAVRAGFCLAAVRESFPAATIVLLAAESTCPIFAKTGLVDKVVSSRLYESWSNAPEWSVRLQKARDLAHLILKLGVGYDLVLTFYWGSTMLNLLARLVGKRSVGYSNRFPGLLSVDLGRYAVDQDAVAQHERLLAAAGVDPSVYHSQPVRLHSSSDEWDVQQLLEGCGLDSASRLIVLHPGSDWACQQWLPERWAALADLLVFEYGADVVFTGLAKEQSYISGMQRLMRAPSVSLAGRTTLKQLEALIARAYYCICVDSVVYELSQSAGIPALVLAGPSLPGLSARPSVRQRVLNRTPVELQNAINACRSPKFASSMPGCLNYQCPMAGLRDIEVGDVLETIEVHAGLIPAADGSSRSKGQHSSFQSSSTVESRGA